MFIRFFFHQKEKKNKKLLKFDCNDATIVNHDLFEAIDYGSILAKLHNWHIMRSNECNQQWQGAIQYSV